MCAGGKQLAINAENTKLSTKDLQVQDVRFPFYSKYAALHMISKLISCTVQCTIFHELKPSVLIVSIPGFNTSKVLLLVLCRPKAQACSPRCFIYVREIFELGDVTP